MVGWCGSQTKAKEYHDLCIRLHSIFAKLLRSTDVKIVHIFICFRSGVDENIAKGTTDPRVEFYLPK